MPTPPLPTRSPARWTRGTPGLRRRAFGRAGLRAVGLGAAAAPLAWAQSDTVVPELKVVSHRVFFGLDPVHDLSASYLRGFGAAEGLLRLNAAGELEPDLARSHELLDPFSWRVTLRPNVTFWSGKVVDARAVVESLERSRQLAPPAAGLLRGVRIEPLDEVTVLFQSESPIPGFPYNLADEWLSVHNATSYGPQDNSFDVGVADLTGSFKVVDFQTRVMARLERNERYWGVLPRTRRIQATEMVDADARALTALSGEAHIVRLIPPASARQVERSRSIRLVSPPAIFAGMAYLNTQRAPFDDVRVRQALSWALDREELVTLALDGYGTPLPSWLAAGPLYPEARRTGYTRPDPVKAGQLLDEAGWRLAPGGRGRGKDGQPLRFRLYWFGTFLPLAEVLQEQWRRIGAEVDVQGAADRGLLDQRRAQNDWDVFIEERSTLGDPSTIANRHVGDGERNYATFRDPEIDRLLAGFDALLDPEERRLHALRINQRHLDVVPFIPLVARNYVTAVHRNVRSYIPHFDLWGPFEVHPDLWAAA